MAFSSTIKESVAGTGSKIRVYGTYVSDSGSTGGDVVTRLNVVEGFLIQPRGSAVLGPQSVVNETFPLTNSTGAVTIVTSADEAGIWEAWGY